MHVSDESHSICFGRTSVVSLPLLYLNVRLWVCLGRNADRLLVFRTPVGIYHCPNTNTFLRVAFTVFSFSRDTCSDKIFKIRLSGAIQQILLVGNFSHRRLKKKKKRKNWDCEGETTLNTQPTLWSVLQYPWYAMCCVNSCCLARKPEHLEVTMFLFSLVYLGLCWTEKRFILKKSQWNAFSPCTQDLSMSKMNLIPRLMCVCSLICRRDLGASTCASIGRMSFRHKCSTQLLPQHLFVPARCFCEARMLTLLPLPVCTAGFILRGHIWEQN